MRSFFLMSFLVGIANLSAANWAPPPIDITPLPGIAAPEAVSAPQIAVDPNGNAVAVWQHTELDSSISIESATYDGTSWTAPFRIQPFIPMSRVETLPQVGVDAAGNAIAVWQQSFMGTSTIQAATLPFGSVAWNVYLSPLSSTGTASNPQIAVNASGNAVAVWELDNMGNNIQASIYDPTMETWTISGIGATLYITALITGQAASTPQVAINDAGNAIVAWNFFNTANYLIEATSYLYNSMTMTYEWGTPQEFPLFGGDGVIGSIPQVGMGPAPSNNGLAVWQQFIGSTGFYTTQAAIFNGMHWGVNSAISPSGGNAKTPQIKVNASGDAVAVWQFENGSPTNIQAARFISGSGWDPAVNISSGLTSGDVSQFPQVSLNDSGNAIAIWQVHSTANTIQASTSISGNIWGAPQTATLSGNVALPQVGIDSSGIKPQAVWSFTDMSNNTFIQAPNNELSPPTNFTGQVIKNHFLTQTDIIDLLSWDPSPNTAVVGYQIILGTEVVATVSASAPLIVSIHNRHKDISYTYALVAYTATDSTSSPIYITVP